MIVKSLANVVMNVEIFKHFVIGKLKGLQRWAANLLPVAHCLVSVYAVALTRCRVVIFAMLQIVACPALNDYPHAHMWN